MKTRACFRGINFLLGLQKFPLRRCDELLVDDIVETANHFRAIDRVILTAKAALTEAYVKRLHEILKSGTTDSSKEWFAVGDYKRLDNVVGEMETCPAKNVRHEMAKLLDWWKGADVVNATATVAIRCDH